MWRKVSFVVAGLLVAVLLITGVTAMTHAASPTDYKVDRPPCGGPPFAGPRMDGAMLDRVAEILKIDKQQLTDAFKQASAEMRQKGIDDMFAKWVSEGKLTEDQATQYKAWMAAKPHVFCRDLQMADKLLKDGKITQDQYTAVKEWLDKKPNVELPKPERPANAPPCVPSQTN